MPRGRVSLGGFLALRRLIAGKRPDAVQTWMYHADLIGGVAARLAGVRAIAWGIRNSGAHLERSSRSARMVLRACAFLSRRVPRAIVCAAQDAAERHAAKGYRRDRMTVISNGYDLSRYAPDAQAGARMRQHWNVPADAPLIGCVARWDPLKTTPTCCARWPRWCAMAAMRACVACWWARHDRRERRAGRLDRTVGPGRAYRAGRPQRRCAGGDERPGRARAVQLRGRLSQRGGRSHGLLRLLRGDGRGRRRLHRRRDGHRGAARAAEALARGIEAGLGEVAARGGRRAGEAGRARVLANFSLARMVEQYIAVWRRISGDQA